MSPLVSTIDDRPQAHRVAGGDRTWRFRAEKAMILPVTASPPQSLEASR